MEPVSTQDIVIAGAGLIGISLALELTARGASVAVLDIAKPMGGASTAAAGMLAAGDPYNPSPLYEFAAYSLSLYDSFLSRLTERSGLPVPYQTHSAIQYRDDGSSVSLAERSIDPRQLAAAALEAARRSHIPILEHCGGWHIEEHPSGIRVQTSKGTSIIAQSLVHASGAWYSGSPAIAPRKGQMLRVRFSPDLALDKVHRSSSIYIVPRTQGPQAATALIGATEEDAGFDLRVVQRDIDALRSRAGALLPELASAEAAPQVEAWAGLRPATRDGLPAIGHLAGSERQWIAGGHFRNGILLAPGTAVALADWIIGKTPAIDLSPFAPSRFT